MTGKASILVAAGALWAAGLATAFAQPARRAPRPPEYSAQKLNALFQGVGIIYGIDPHLLSAIAEVESGYRPDAVSCAGAQGLMQLMPATAARYGVADACDPAQNTIGAARFLKRLKRSHPTEEGPRASLPEVLAAYNAGPAAVRRYGGVPPYPETRSYVRRVLWLYFTGYVPVQAAAKARVQAAPARLARKKEAAPGDAAVLARLARLRNRRAKTRKMLRSWKE